MKPLNLEDCKWLKEAGFPQDEEKCPKYVKYDHEPDARIIDEWEDNEFPAYKFLCACPSLEELLEWAKDKIPNLDIHRCQYGWHILSSWGRADERVETIDLDSEDAKSEDLKVMLMHVLRAVLTAPTDEHCLKKEGK